MRVLVFARLREALGSDALTLPAVDSPATVGELRARLARHERTEFAAAIAAPNVLCAVNQRVAGDEQPLSADDEIAFFPPVTGG